MKPTYTDDTLMPWGQHRNKRLGDVPASHFVHLLSQRWIDEYPALFDYLKKNKDTFLAQVAAEEKLKGDVDIPGTQRFETFEDYVKDYKGF